MGTVAVTMQGAVAVLRLESGVTQAVGTDLVDDERAIDARVLGDLPDRGLERAAHDGDADLDVVMSNSFGFGGTNG